MQQVSSITAHRAEQGKSGGLSDSESVLDACAKQEILDAVKNRLSEARFCDVTFVCADDQIVRANKAFLCSRSDYFDRMLYGEMAEAGAAHVYLPGVSACTLQHVINYLHNGTLPQTLTSSEILDLLVISDANLLSTLGQLAIARALKMVSTFTPSEFSKLFSWALDHSCPELQQTAWLRYPSVFQEGLDLQGHSVSAAKFALQSCALRPQHESRTMKAVLDWIQKEVASSESGPTTAAAVFLELLPFFRLEYIHPAVLEQLLELYGLRALEAEIYKQQMLQVNQQLVNSFSLQPCRPFYLQWQPQEGLNVVCSSAKHATAIVGPAFTSGKHCWQVRVIQPATYTWVGIATEDIVRDGWGGREAGGWFYGSNDALCHATGQDNGPYTSFCGHGQWDMAGAVVTHCLDMDSRQLWFAVDGLAPRLGFVDLPARVFPAVSLRELGEVVVSFRSVPAGDYPHTERATPVDTTVRR